MGSVYFISPPEPAELTTRIRSWFKRRVQGYEKIIDACKFFGNFLQIHLGTFKTLRLRAIVLYCSIQIRAGLQMLHYETIEPATLELLKELQRLPDAIYVFKHVVGWCKKQDRFGFAIEVIEGICKADTIKNGKKRRNRKLHLWLCELTAHWWAKWHGVMARENEHVVFTPR